MLCWGAMLGGGVQSGGDGRMGREGSQGQKSDSDAGEWRDPSRDAGTHTKQGEVSSAGSEETH